MKEKIKNLLAKLNVMKWTKKQRIIAIAVIALFVVGLSLGLSLGLTLPIKSVVAEGGAVLLEGETYEEGLFLRVTRRSGKTTRFEVKPYMIDPFDSSERGEKDVLVTYKDRKIHATILVVGLEETTCSVRLGSLKTEYEPKEAFSTGGILDISYNDKTFRSFPITPDMVTYFDTTTSGEFEATITFRDTISCVYRYTVMKVIKSLSAVGKLYAEQGSPLTKENVMGNGMILVTYTDDTTDTVSIYNEYVEIKTVFLEEKAENYQTTLELVYRGQTFVFAAEAYLKGEQYSVEDLELILPKRVYKVGEKVSLEDAILNVKYRYYTGFVRVAITEDMVENYAPFASPAESVDFTVLYMGGSVTATARVVSEEDAETVTDLSTTWRGSSSGNLACGDELDFKNAFLLVEYGYGYSQKSVVLNADFVSGYDKDVAGLQTLTLTYQGFSSDLQIVVTSPDDSDLVTALMGVLNWENITYKTSPALVIADGARLMVEYGYGARTGEVSMKDVGVTFEGFTPGVVGIQKITIKYEGKSIEWSVSVADDTILGVTAMTVNMSEFVLGEEFDPVRVRITLEFEGGKRVEQRTLAELVATGATYEFDDPVYNPDVEDSYVLRVYFRDFSEFGWVILRNLSVVLSGLSLDVSGGKTAYAVGEGLDLAGYLLTANYSDSTSEIVPLTYDMIGGFDSSEKGTFYASVTYNGQITYFAYTIN